MNASIQAIDFELPERVVTNHDLAGEFSGWTPEQIQSKTGIDRRRVAAPAETASDLGYRAAERLLGRGIVDRGAIDALLYCTQSPDYFLPTTACLLQERLRLPTTVAALDFNLGCSGYVYGLGLAAGLLQSGQARNLLLITGDTYSRFLHPGDRGTRTIFGDGAAATLITAQEGEGGLTGPFVYGTDGRGAPNLIVPVGGLRQRWAEGAPVVTDKLGGMRSEEHLYMNGPEIFNFTLRIVPATVNELLARSALRLDQIDLFVFHQANRYMLEHLRKRLEIPADKFVISMQDCGNTVSSTIPIALAMAEQSGQLRRGMRVMLLGFGVGYSWGGTVIRWRP